MSCLRLYDTFELGVEKFADPVHRYVAAKPSFEIDSTIVHNVIYHSGFPPAGNAYVKWIQQQKYYKVCQTVMTNLVL